jgi:hypothetical protein
VAGKLPRPPGRWVFAVPIGKIPAISRNPSFLVFSACGCTMTQVLVETMSTGGRPFQSFLLGAEPPNDALCSHFGTGASVRPWTVFVETDE